MRHTFFATLLASSLMSAAAFAHQFEVGDLEIGHPYARAMLPGAEVGGGYLSITNKGNEADRLVKASSPDADAVQVHEMSMDGQVMKMRQLPDGVEIKPGETVVLKPGGYHLMFMKVKEPFVEGKMVPAKLEFEKAGSVDVEFKVESPTADHSKGKHVGGGHGAHDMGAMKGMEKTH